MIEDKEKQKVLIKIKGMQGELAEEVIEMTTTGTLYDEMGTIFVDYIDTYMDDEIETKTTIEITDDKITVTRLGAASTTMIFETAEEQVMAYDTSFGVFEIVTNTKSIAINKTEASLDLVIAYSLVVNQNSMGISNFEMHATYIN